MVEGGDEFHILFSDGLGQFSHHIPPGAHVHAIPARQAAVPHGEAVSEHGNGTANRAPAFLNRFAPGIGIEFLRLEHGDESLNPNLFKAP